MHVFHLAGHLPAPHFDASLVEPLRQTVDLIDYEDARKLLVPATHEEFRHQRRLEIQDIDDFEDDGPGVFIIGYR
jgi:hypothetical protein